MSSETIGLDMLSPKNDSQITIVTESILKTSESGEKPSAEREQKKLLDLQNFNNGPQVVSLLNLNAMKKAKYCWWASIANGFLAGVFVSLGGFLALSMGGGISQDIVNNNPAIGKFLIGSMFGVALVLIAVVGGELFTGNLMIMTLGFLNKKVSCKKVLINWLCVFIGNFLSCLFMAFVFGYVTELYANEPHLPFVRHVAEQKALLSPHVIFIKAVPANALVCLALTMAAASREMSGKVPLLMLPVLAFAGVGFEHSVANMFFISIGMFYGANVNINQFIANVFLAAIGNFVGGGVFVAGLQFLLYAKDSF